MERIEIKLKPFRYLFVSVFVAFASLTMAISNVSGSSSLSETSTSGVGQPQEATEDQAPLEATIEQSLTPQASLDQVNTGTSTLQFASEEVASSQEMEDTGSVEDVSHDMSPTEGTPEPTLIPAFTLTAEPSPFVVEKTHEPEPSPSAVEETHEPELDGKILVKVDTTINSAIHETLLEYGNLIPSPLEDLGIFILEVNQPSIGDQIDQLLMVPGVVYAEQNYYVETLAVPNDPLISNQYGLEAIRAYEAWNYATGISPVTLAILDTGIDFAHPEFAGRLTVGYDFINLDDDPQDDNGHGTSVTGVAAAIANNSEGIAGLNWGAQIMPVKVLNSSGVGTYADVASGIVWAVNNGGDVINLSLGGSGIPPSSALLDAVNYAHSNGLVIVAAAGNSNSGVFYPAIYSNVIAVAATDLTNTRMANSNHGPEIDISAPGNSIFSTSLGGGYGYSSGTSMAAPYVSGLAAILKGIDPSLSPEEIDAILKTSALDLGPLGFDDFYGAGLIQANDAVLLVIVPISSSNFVDERENDEEEKQDVGSTKVEQVTQATPTRRATVTSEEVVGLSHDSELTATSTSTAATPTAEQVATEQLGVLVDGPGVLESSENGWLAYFGYGLMAALSVAGFYFLFSILSRASLQ